MCPPPALADQIRQWIPGRYRVLGTDGYGRSDSRKALRDFFEVDARHIAFAALSALGREKAVPLTKVKKARKSLDIDPGRPNPLFS